MNPDRAVQARALGQSLWYDNISRQLLDSGELAALVKAGIITGITTNPSIFQKAIDGSDAYDDAIRRLVKQGCGVQELYDALTIEDVQRGADLLRPVHEASDGVDGYISLEVLPSLAHDVESTVAEARRLARAVDRPNVMIKVPGTAEGVEAFRRLTAEGVHVNVTLLFSMGQYEAIAEAYREALRERAARGESLRLASVASFFVSRVDGAVDAALQSLAGATSGSERERLLGLQGKAGVANCLQVYARFQDLFEPDFDDLRRQGARVQRMLWASTSTKNPAYPDTLYVDPLLGPDTVNTLPPHTLEAFLDHGVAERVTVTEGVAEARHHLEELARQGIDLDAVCEQLQVDGVKAFAKAFDGLLEALGRKVPVSP